MQPRSDFPWITASWIFVVAAAAFVVAWPSGVGISWDLYAYLTSAGILNQGGGFTSLGRPDIARSGFVAMLAGLQRLGVESVDGIFVFITLWAAALIAASFLLAWRLFGLAVGIVTALLLLASRDFILALPRHLDQVWPTLLLLAATLLYAPTRLPTMWAAIGAGLLVGFAITVKETAAVFLALPILLVVLGFPRGRWMAGFYVAAGLFLAGWFFAGTWISPQGDASYAQMSGQNLATEGPAAHWFEAILRHVRGALGKAASTRISTLDWGGVSASLWRILKDFPLLLLSVPAVAFLYLAWKRGRERMPIGYLLALSFATAPLFVLTAVSDLRLGQMLLVPVLGAMAVAAAMRLFMQRWRNQVPFAGIAVICVAVAALASTPVHWRWPWFATVKTERDAEAWEHARLVSLHVPKNSILIAWLGAGRYLAPFLTEGIAYRALPRSIIWPSECGLSDGSSDIITMPMSIAPGGSPSVVGLPAEQLSILDGQASEGRDVYAMIRTDPEFMLYRWLEANPQAEPVHRGGVGRDEIAIYRLKQPFRTSLGEPTLRVDERFIADADANLLPETYSWRWDDRRRDAYREWVEACLEAQPALTGTDFDWKAGR